MALEPDWLTLLLLALPIASIAWTVTHEEIFREPREWCAVRSKSGSSAAARKFFYVFTCEYCFSHWVTVGMLVITRFHLLYADWRGYLVGGFALVFVANVYMSLFGLIRLEVRQDRIEIEAMEQVLDPESGEHDSRA